MSENDVNNNSKFYAPKLEEKIYYGIGNCGQEETEKTIRAFFNEMISRKRGDIPEAGLQLSGVIYDNCFAFKVNEKNGMALHDAEHLNLTAFLNYKLKHEKEPNYLTPLGFLNNRLMTRERGQILTEGTAIKFMCSEKQMVLYFDDNTEGLSETKINVIQALVNLCDEIKQIEELDNISFLLGSKRYEVENEDLDTESCAKIIDDTDKMRPQNKDKYLEKHRTK